MVQVDLITGFLGSGKTTFLRKYVQYLVAQGHNVCILENDFGAVNVDAMLGPALSRQCSKSWRISATALSPTKSWKTAAGACWPG